MRPALTLPLALERSRARRSRPRSGPIALAAVSLFTEGDFSRIRECGGHACGWLFYDRSKNNRRRWCEMEVCGNRAKQRRLAARRREGVRRRLAIRLILLIAAATLAGCSPALETDQARLCRMALPALMPEGARIAILAQTPDADARGLSVAFTAGRPARRRETISPSAASASPDGRANRAT